MFITLFRSVPTTATEPAFGGTVWACGSIQSQLDGPGRRWVELLVYQGEESHYVTSEMGEALGLGYLPEEDWYSFPIGYLIQWRWYGEGDWKNGPGFRKHATTFRKWQTERTKQRQRDRSHMIHDGVDWEKILAQEGLGLID